MQIRTNVGPAALDEMGSQTLPLPFVVPAR